MKILVLNGPNLNLLGTREPEIYGSMTLKEIEAYTKNKLKDISMDWYQSNLEGELIEKIQNADSLGYSAIIINPAGYSHTSVAILDALKTFKGLIAEVHLSNVYKREQFRQTMLTAQASTIIMGGLSHRVYYQAALALKDILLNL